MYSKKTFNMSLKMEYIFRNVENYNKKNWCFFFFVHPKVNVGIPT